MKKTILIALFLAPVFANAQSKATPADNTHTYNMVKNPNSTSDEFKKNYSTGIAYFNRAVSLIQNTDESTGTVKLEQVTDQCKELFKIALPYLEKCYELNPKYEGTLTALSGIHFALDDVEKSKKIQKEQESLKSK